LKQIGESTADMVFRVRLARRNVRIFTGAPVRLGANDFDSGKCPGGGRLVEPLEPVARGRNIRAKGSTTEGRFCLLLERGLAHRTSASRCDEFRRGCSRPAPRVAILATGDELVWPANDWRRSIVATNSFAIAALVEAAGGEPVDLGIARMSWRP